MQTSPFWLGIGYYYMVVYFILTIVLYLNLLKVAITTVPRNTFFEHKFNSHLRLLFVKLKLRSYKSL